LTGSVFLRSIADNDKVVAHITERERERKEEGRKKPNTHIQHLSAE
jgi:hypothetical protein